MSDPLIGRPFGKYEIQRKIGQGGMGVVYLARQISLNRVVAIKVLPAQMALDEDFVRRFRQEGELIAGLDHEHVVRIYDVDRIDDLYCIVMEYVEGQSLRQLLHTRTLNAWDVRAFGVPVASALDYAHRRGIVHRDIKSANVMVTAEGRVKLMDFGIAKAAGSAVKTVTGAVLGTPEYMAPEQARSGRVSVATDVYSLGVLLYELATGKVPFTAEDPFAVALKHVSEEPLPPSQLVATIPEWLERTILRAMAKDPAGRHASAGEIERELLVAGGPLDAETVHPLDVLEATRVSVSRASGGTAGKQVSLITDPMLTSAVTLPRPSGEIPAALAAATPAGTSPPSAAVGLATAAGSPARRLGWPIAGVAMVALLLSALLFARGRQSEQPNADPASVAVLLGEARHHLEQGRFRDVMRLTGRMLASGAVDPEISALREQAAQKLENEAESDLLAQVVPPPFVPEAALKSKQPAAREPALSSLPLVAAEPESPSPAEPPPKTPEELWKEALELKDDGRIDSLGAKLEEVIAADPTHAQAREWLGQLGDWQKEHRDNMERLLRRQVDGMVDAFRKRDLAGLANLFGRSQPDDTLRATFQPLWDRYPVARLRVELGKIEIHDRSVGFEAQVVIDVKERKGLGGWKHHADQVWVSRLVDDWGWAHFGEPLVLAANPAQPPG